MAAEKVITTTNMCVRMDDRLMAAEKVIATTTKICMRECMHVKMHVGQMHVKMHTTRIFPRCYLCTSLNLWCTHLENSIGY